MKELDREIQEVWLKLQNAKSWEEVNAILKEFYLKNK